MERKRVYEVIVNASHTGSVTIDLSEIPTRRGASEWSEADVVTADRMAVALLGADCQVKLHQLPTGARREYRVADAPEWVQVPAR